jgi:hypothetical protein
MHSENLCSDNPCEQWWKNRVQLPGAAVFALADEGVHAPSPESDQSLPTAAQSRTSPLRTPEIHRLVLSYPSMKPRPSIKTTSQGSDSKPVLVHGIHHIFDR